MIRGVFAVLVWSTCSLADAAFADEGASSRGAERTGPIATRNQCRGLSEAGESRPPRVRFVDRPKLILHSDISTRSRIAGSSFFGVFTLTLTGQVIISSVG